MEHFTVQDVRARTGDLIRAAQAGKLSVVTKHGAPVFVAVPCDEHLVRVGVTLALAVHLFDEARISLGKAAQLAGMSRIEFTRLLADRRIPVIRTSAEDIEQELSAFGADFSAACVAS